MKGIPTRGRRRIQTLHDLANDGGYVALKTGQLRTERYGDTEKGCQKSAVHKKTMMMIGRSPASVAQWAEAQCAPTGTVCRRGGVQFPGRPVDFVFGFQGRML